MAGSISSLGAGSGTLTSEVITKLKEADESQVIKPYETKIENNKTQTSDLSTLKKLAESVQDLTDSLSGEMNYLGRSTEVTGNNATVTVEAGAAVQDFTLEVHSLAQKQISQSKEQFASEDTALGKSGTLSLKIDGKDYNIKIKDTMSLKDIKNAIFDGTDEKVIGSSINVGSTDGKPFSLVLKSVKSGESNSFEVTNDMGFGLKDVQKAQNAEFEYNGVSIMRDTNKIDDLMSGVTINLKEAGTKNDDGTYSNATTSVNITQDTSSVLENVDKFVEKYNELISNLNAVTQYDSDEGVRGTFQGNSEMNSIKYTIKNALVNNVSGILSDYGFDVQRNGTIEYDKSDLEAKIKKDPKDVQEFFQGVKKTDTTEKKTGLFESLDDAMDSLLTTKNGLFKLAEDDLSDRATRLKESMERAQSRLDKKYKIMEKQFASYDSMMTNYTNGFASLKYAMQAATSSSS